MNNQNSDTNNIGVVVVLILKIKGAHRRRKNRPKQRERRDNEVGNRRSSVICHAQPVCQGRHENDPNTKMRNRGQREICNQHTDGSSSMGTEALLSMK